MSWSLKGLLVDLLYQLDKTKANAMFLESFRGPPPTEGSFDRSTILESMIKYDFEENRDFLRRWYWLSQNRDFGYHPSEAGAILSTLKSTSDETRKLYRQITKNPRFVPEVDD